MSKKTLDKMVSEYAQAMRDGCYSYENELPPLICLALEADVFTAPHLAALLLLENEGLADLPYRFGGDMFDPALAEMARAIRWVGP